MRRPLVIVALTVAVSGCGSDSLDQDAATAYVDAQAHAFCIVQSTAFATQAEHQAAYEQARNDSGLSTGQLANAEDDDALRQRVSDRVVALCG